MLIAFAFLLLVHGIAHVVGFAGAWQIGPSVTHQTTILAGAADVGEAGIRALGLMWLALAVAFGIAAVGMVARAAWSPALVLIAATVSLLLCVVAWPDAQAGAALDMMVLVAVASGMRLGWFAELPH
jgi:xanthine/uracil/vitamin C permease (AzgA family)